MPNYFVCSGAAGTGTGLSWVNACTSIPALMTAITSIVGGDIIYVHNTHNYNAGAAITWTLPETGTGLVQVICVDGGDAAFTSAGASMGTTVGNITTGAVETTGGNFAFNINTSSNLNSALFVHGIAIRTGAGASSANADLSVNTTSIGAMYFSSCDFWMDSTNTGALLGIGNSSANRCVFYACTFRFSATGCGFVPVAGVLEFYDCSISVSGSSPTTLFLSTSATRNLMIYCSGCDWSLATNTATMAMASSGKVVMNNCVIGTPTTGTHAGLSAMEYEFQACAAVDGTNGADILSYYSDGFVGVVQDDQTIYLTTGSATGEQDDGTDTPYSLVMQPNTNASKAVPLYTPWIYTLVGSTGAKTITMKACDAGADADELHNSELWLEVEFMGEPESTGTTRVANAPHTQRWFDDAASPDGVPLMASSKTRDVTAAGTDRTDTDEAWSGIVETNTYTLTASVTCDEVGYIRCRVGLAFDRDVYVDPKIGVA